MKRNTSYEQALRAALADSAKDENGVLVYNPEAAAPVEAETVYDPTDYRADDLSSREALQPMQQANRRVGRKAVTWTLAIGLVTGVAYGTERFVVGEDIDLAVHLQDYGKLPQTIPRVAQETGHNIEAVQQNADMIGKVFNQIFNQGNK
jgi:hypothetical protein